MIDPNKKPDSQVNSSDVCYRAFELIGAKQYNDAEKLLASNMAKTDDDASIALYHSVMGVLFKVQGDFKTAWKHYQRAEKLLPNDPALKIISARLMIDQFAQYGPAIKKAKKVLELIPGNAVFAHQAHSTIGLAHFKKGDRKKAIAMLESSWGDDFRGFVTAKNVDFELVEALTRRGWGLKSCRSFISKAYDYAVATGEEAFVSLFDKMLNAFDNDYPDVVSSETDLPQEV